MLVYVLLLIVVFACAVAALLTLRLNKNQLKKLIYYQYNYIPESLTDIVTVKNLKQHTIVVYD
ncbi:unknown [Euproctis pseudoconspersa nucleopolyhedrovirus]|uniref:Ac110 n=1 Tax=Euproctis pseudoconspersa nucleopolyhedrovirus TaxID=307467 RepID=C3TX00_9ABAC|nr:hypothetical protein EupsNPV_gp092 [Euproctis pseudoconspersa nucleopolyhedrovirus]ACO53542.1 unknown [Euproctis pseudoconspersa nucleopolyhedrovirus]QUJ09282.1 hypothetical protein Gyru_ORF87 [Gynaephora ruoergensis nucleopolyhedrovirus]